MNDSHLKGAWKRFKHTFPDAKEDCLQSKPVADTQQNKNSLKNTLPWQKQKQSRTLTVLSNQSNFLHENAKVAESSAVCCYHLFLLPLALLFSDGRTDESFSNENRICVKFKVIPNAKMQQHQHCYYTDSRWKTSSA